MIAGSATQGQQIVRSYQYDAVGELLAVNDLRKGQTRYGYDKLGRSLSAHHPYSLQETFAFNPAHNLISADQTQPTAPANQESAWSDEQWQAYVKANIDRPDLNPWLTPEQVENYPRFWGIAVRIACKHGKIIAFNTITLVIALKKSAVVRPIKPFDAWSGTPSIG